MLSKSAMNGGVSTFAHLTHHQRRWVLLGMLGTFLGMVVTFKGAVFALQASADLQAIRSVLAEPI